MRGRFWLAGIAAAVGSVVMSAAELGSVMSIGPTATVAAADQARTTSASGLDTGTWTADTRNGWRDDRGTRYLQLSLRSRDDHEQWGFGVPFADLEGLPAAARDGAAANVTFRLVREAGTITLRGSFDDGHGSGDYGFAPNSGYAAAMAALGYRDLPPGRQMKLAVLDVTSAFAREVRDAGQTALTLDELTRFRIHGVSGANIRELAALGFRSLDPDTLIRLRIHGATPERIRGFQQAGLTALSADDAVRLRIHGVTPEFIQGLKTRGYSGLDADDLTRMRIHGVSLDEIDGLKAAGVSGVSASELVTFRIHGVSPAFVRDLRGAGLTSADADDFVKMRIHRVDAAFVRDARADGYEIRDADDAVDLAIHGRRRRR